MTLLFQIFACITLYGAGLFALFVVLKTEHLRDRPGFQWACVATLPTAGVLFIQAFGFGYMTIVFFLPAGFIWGGVFCYLFACFVGRLRGWSLGEGNIQVEPTFDRAEALERRGDRDGAMKMYRDYAQRSPLHAETRRRLGEAYVATGDLDQGLMELRAALGLSADPEKKLLGAFRIVDLLIQRSNDVFNAELILRELEKDYAGTKVAELAKAKRERLPVADHRGIGRE